MGALLSRAELDGLLEPKLLAELPNEKVRKQVRAAVAKAGKGEHGTIRLGSLAGPVREAAKRLQAHGKPSKKLARVLPQISRIPGY